MIKAKDLLLGSMQNSLILLLVIFLTSIQTWRHLRHLQIIITSTKLHKIPFVVIKSNLTYVCSFVFTSVSSMALSIDTIGSQNYKRVTMNHNIFFHRTEVTNITGMKTKKVKKTDRYTE